MIHGFIKVAAITPEMRVADCDYNGDKIIEYMEACERKDVKIAVFPELAITGYTCGDLFLQERLLDEAMRTLKRIVETTEGLDLFAFVGLPVVVNGKVYNGAAAIKDGKLLGVIPKKNGPNYTEHYELRTFSMALDENEIVDFGYGLGKAPFGTKILFECENFTKLKIAAEICEDLWVPIPESNHHAIAGATVIANLSASVEVTGKHIYRRSLVKGQSARLMTGYLYSSSGNGESSTDMVFGGHSMIGENGDILVEKPLFEDGMIVAEIDLERLIHDRRRVNTFGTVNTEKYTKIPFSVQRITPMITLERKIPKSPFLPESKEERKGVCEEAIAIQTMGLKKRLDHIHGKNAVIGVSGGLDSTLALLIICKAFDELGLDRKGITAVTMPCFGTTGRTYGNATDLAKRLGVTLREIDIKEAVILHLRDIGHDLNVHDVTYENAQARERTQVLMDIANDVGGIVVGTGDMSEMALGWATYNGDHMSMYGVNAAVPKTMVRHLVMHFAEFYQGKGDEEVSEVLYDILDTPVSPELLPPDENGKIKQKTEDIVGPYELHDFFLFYMLRWGFSPDKIYRLACTAFHDEYEEGFIHHWLKTFYHRFFISQYKRSCVPDGVRVTNVGLSPRGDFRMPSDASVRSWMKIIDEIAPKDGK